MVVLAFPLAKLGALLLRQVSRPIAKFCEKEAKDHPIFRKYVCIPPGRVYHWVEVKTKMWILHLGKPVKVPPITEAMAVELGASLIGESVLFIVAAGILISELSKASRKEAEKQAKIDREKAHNRIILEDLYELTKSQGKQLHELTKIVYELDGREYHEEEFVEERYKPPPMPGKVEVVVPPHDKAAVLLDIIDEYEPGEQDNDLALDDFESNMTYWYADQYPPKLSIIPMFYDSLSNKIIYLFVKVKNFFTNIRDKLAHHSYQTTEQHHNQLVAHEHHSQLHHSSKHSHHKSDEHVSEEKIGDAAGDGTKHEKTHPEARNNTEHQAPASEKHIQSSTPDRHPKEKPGNHEVSTADNHQFSEKNQDNELHKEHQKHVEEKQNVDVPNKNNKPVNNEERAAVAVLDQDRLSETKDNNKIHSKAAGDEHHKPVLEKHEQVIPSNHEICQELKDSEHKQDKKAHKKKKKKKAMKKKEADESGESDTKPQPLSEIAENAGDHSKHVNNAKTLDGKSNGKVFKSQNREAKAGGDGDKFEFQIDQKQERCTEELYKNKCIDGYEQVQGLTFLRRANHFQNNMKST